MGLKLLGFLLLCLGGIILTQKYLHVCCLMISPQRANISSKCGVGRRDIASVDDVIIHDSYG